MCESNKGATNMSILPYSEEQTREQAQRDRGTAITLAGIQIESIRDHYNKRREVSHRLFERLVQSVKKIGSHIPLTATRAQEFEAKMNKAGTDQFTVHVDGNRVYLEGYFDLSKLHREILW
jgi:hypothetical protein